MSNFGASSSSEEASSLLPLLSVAGSLQSGLTSLETTIQQQLVGLRSLLERQAGSASSLVRLRLQHSGVGLDCNCCKMLEQPISDFTQPSSKSIYELSYSFILHCIVLRCFSLARNCSMPLLKFKGLFAKRLSSPPMLIALEEICWGRPFCNALTTYGLLKSSMSMLQEQLESRLQETMSAAETSAFKALPESSAAVQEFSDTVQQLIFDMLMSKVRKTKIVISLRIK